MNVGCYLIDKTIPLPHHGSEFSACYDLHASLYPERVKMRCRNNEEDNVKLKSDNNGKYLDRINHHAGYNDIFKSNNKNL